MVDRERETRRPVLMGLQGDAPPAATQVESAKQRRARQRREEIHEQVVGGWRELGQGISNLGQNIAELPGRANRAFGEFLVRGQRQAWGLEEAPGPGPSLSEIAYLVSNGYLRSVTLPTKLSDHCVSRL